MMAQNRRKSALPPLDREGGREAAGWGVVELTLHPLRLASLGTSPIEGEEGVGFFCVPQWINRHGQFGGRSL